MTASLYERLLAQFPPYSVRTPAELSCQLGLASSTVYRLLSRLISEGRVEQISQGLYRRTGF